MLREQYAKYGASLIFIALVALAVYIISPYLVAIMFAAVLAVLINPIYLLLKKYLRSESVSALIASVLTILVILLPILAIINTLIIEAAGLYSEINIKLQDSSFNVDFVNNLLASLGNYSVDIQATINQIFSVIISLAQNFILGVPAGITTIFITIFITYFMLKEQDKILDTVKRLIPLDAKHKQQVLDRSASVTKGVLFGTLLTAFIQGVVAAIGYWFFGVSAPIIFGILTMFFALIPFVGTGIVWIPAGTYLTLMHLDDGYWWRGVGLLVYGALIVGTIDNILKPKLIGDNAQLHPAFALVGIFGGLHVFGAIGIILGPLLLAVIIQYILVYNARSAQTAAETPTPANTKVPAKKKVKSAA